MFNQIQALQSAVQKLVTEQNRLSKMFQNYAFNDISTESSSSESIHKQAPLDTTLRPVSHTSTVSFVPVGERMSHNVLPMHPDQIPNLPAVDPTNIAQFTITDDIQPSEETTNDMKEFTAQLKIIGAPTNNVVHFANRLISNNRWLQIKYLRVDEVYKTSRSYTNSHNFIVTLDKEAHQKCIEFGQLSFARNICRIYDKVITPCKRCQSLSHHINQCQQHVICKRCAANHHYSRCPISSEHPQCINCIVSNQDGATYRTGHNATYGGCPTMLALLGKTQHLHCDD